ncbi:hypothetical protein HanXRQr2_Chr11g0469781 [Helianthus annuus]|uniref:Uncharacterized protein n=1 Tax=Helianthus annuus TaxID=4232 RepID=A0A9K3MYE4_HELAN|nr:hypothetical protein HanXRQr2_Chr11g0469781 [Helianthus annuus]
MPESINYVTRVETIRSTRIITRRIGSHVHVVHRYFRERFGIPRHGQLSTRIVISKHDLRKCSAASFSGVPDPYDASDPRVALSKRYVKWPAACEY